MVSSLALPLPSKCSRGFHLISGKDLRQPLVIINLQTGTSRPVQLLKHYFFVLLLGEVEPILRTVVICRG